MLHVLLIDWLIDWSTSDKLIDWQSANCFAPWNTKDRGKGKDQVKDKNALYCLTNNATWKNSSFKLPVAGKFQFYMTVNSIFIDYLKLKSMVQNNIVWLTFSHYTAEKKRKLK